MIALAGRLAVEQPEELAACFPDQAQRCELPVTTGPIL
jgi:hypothetical protein